jgi:hypothetical protein
MSADSYVSDSNFNPSVSLAGHHQIGGSMSVYRTFGRALDGSSVTFPHPWEKCRKHGENILRLPTMQYERNEFSPFSAEAQRVRANLEQSYTAWVDAKREIEALPASMFWKTVGDVQYLAIKENSSANAKSHGRRDAAGEQRLASMWRNCWELT